MIGVVLAGGQSLRFGGISKGLVAFKGMPMALRSVHLLAEFCDQIVIEAPMGAGYDMLGVPLIYAAAEHAGKGPLAGIAAGLALAAGNERVAFAPCDMPLLTRDIYRALIDVGAGAYAMTAPGAEPLVAVLIGVMRISLVETLAAAELPRTHAALDRAGATAVRFDDAKPFANVNTPDDLARLDAGG